MVERLTVDDFFTGLFAALAKKRQVTLSLRDERFDRAVQDLVLLLLSTANKWGIDVRFRVLVHPLHGDSEVVRDALTCAAQRGLIGFDGPVYQDIRLKISDEEATLLLSKVVGGEPLFSYLATEFLQQYA